MFKVDGLRRSIKEADMENKREWNIKKYLLQFLVSAILFFCVSIPFRKFFAFAEVTEVRPASVFPIVCGLLFGLPGALGTAVGNFFGDIYSGYEMSFCIAGFFAQFLFGYLPYKFWYAPLFAGGFKHKTVDKSGRKAVSLADAGSVGKYMALVVADSMLMTGYLSLLMEYFGISSEYTVATLMLLLNNIVFGIVLGIPMLIAADVLRLQKNIPCSKKDGKLWPTLSDASMALSVLVLLLFFVLHGRIDVRRIILPVYVLSYVYVFKPARVADRIKENRFTLNEKMVLIFMLLSLFSALLVGAGVYIECMGQESVAFVDLWNRIYLYVTFDLVLFNGLSLVLLLYIQKNITEPVEQMSQAAADYLRDEGENAENGLEGKVFETYEYLNSEVGELAVSLSQMIRNIEVYIENLTAMTADKERIGAELSIATHIQSSMLPCIFPAFPDRKEFDVYATMNPAKEVGGDFYDFFMVDERHVAVVMADVSGKGVPAALFMVIGKTLIKDHTQPGISLGSVFSDVNNLLCDSNSEGMFITAFEGVLDLATGEFTYVNAGHETPYICRKGEGFEAYKVPSGFVLAGMEDMRYKEGRMQLAVGDRIFLYTDGVPEATNADNEMYGSGRLHNALNEHKDKALEELLTKIKADVDSFVKEAPQFDDITMLCLEYKEPLQSE